MSVVSLCFLEVVNTRLDELSFTTFSAKGKLQGRISLATDTGREMKNDPYPFRAVGLIKPSVDFTEILNTVWWSELLHREPHLVLVVLAEPEAFL